MGLTRTRWDLVGVRMRARLFCSALAPVLLLQVTHEGKVLSAAVLTYPELH